MLCIAFWIEIRNLVSFLRNVSYAGLFIICWYIGNFHQQIYETPVVFQGIKLRLKFPELALIWWSSRLMCLCDGSFCVCIVCKEIKLVKDFWLNIKKKMLINLCCSAWNIILGIFVWYPCHDLYCCSYGLYFCSLSCIGCFSSSTELI